MKNFSAYWQVYLGTWKKYFIYETRASRFEYWLFYLTNLAIYLVLAIAGGNVAFSKNIFLTAFAVASFIPELTAAIRRLHDSNRSGWWILISVIPIIGWIIIIYMLIQPSDQQANRFGEPPVDFNEPYLGAS